MSYFCTNCGFEITDYSVNFCPNCGTATGANAQQTTTVVNESDTTLGDIAKTAIGVSLINRLLHGSRRPRRPAHRIPHAPFHPAPPRPGHRGPGGGRGPGGRGPGGRGPGGRGPW